MCFISRLLMEVKPACHMANLFARTEIRCTNHVTTEFLFLSRGKRVLKVEVGVDNCTCVHAKVSLFKFTNILLPKNLSNYSSFLTNCNNPLENLPS